MSKEKQIKWLEDLAEDILEQYTDGYSRVDKEMLAVALYNIGCRKQREWIRVEERLPDREGKYLVCTTNGNIGVGNFIDYYGKGTRLRFDCWAVTHWMPLPEAPKGGAE